jgi:hypothetical protein
MLCRLTPHLHGATSQKTAFFKYRVVRKAFNLKHSLVLTGTFRLKPASQFVERYHNVVSFTVNITPRSWAFLEKSPVSQLLENFPTFYGTQRFITMLTRALHRSLSWATASTSHNPMGLHGLFTTIALLFFFFFTFTNHSVFPGCIPSCRSH